jgi:hypothetical protein
MAWRPTRAVRKTPGPGYSKTWRRSTLPVSWSRQEPVAGSSENPRLFPHAAEFFSREASGVAAARRHVLTTPHGRVPLIGT